RARRSRVGVAALEYPYAPTWSARTVSIVISRTFRTGVCACVDVQIQTAVESTPATIGNHDDRAWFGWLVIASSPRRGGRAGPEARAHAAGTGDRPAQAAARAPVCCG